MKCMYAQTRPWFILSSEGVFGGMEFEPMLTPKEKSPLPENVPRGGSNPRHCGQQAQALPTELFRPPHCCYESDSQIASLAIDTEIQRHTIGAGEECKEGREERVGRRRRTRRRRRRRRGGGGGGGGRRRMRRRRRRRSRGRR